MAKKTELKKLSIQKDYIMWSLISNAHGAIGVICSYMQDKTPYGEEYLKAFKAYKKVRKELDKLEDALATCTELENYKK